jgi:hypothetical protein
MSRIVGPSLFSLILALIPGSVSILAAQDEDQKVPPVRVAASVTAPAENRPRVFISNVGGDTERPVDKGLSFTGGPAQAYDKFYAAVQGSGQYQLVGSPAEADYVFEILYMNPIEVKRKWVDKNDPSKYDTHPRDQEIVQYNEYHPRLQLVILDPITHAVHGVYIDHIEIGYTQEERDANFSFSIKLLVGHAGSLLGRSPISGDVPRLASDPPAPSQIASAKTVFISNAISSDSAYHRFYAMMQGWGGYQLTPGPAGADLIIQVSDGPRVAVLDPQTGVTLWRFTPNIEGAILKRNAEKNFDQAMATIVSDIARMSSRPAPGSSTAQGVKDAGAPPYAPMPPQLRSAKTVFISNAGGEPLSDWKNRPVQPYNAFYATIKSWARFKVVPTPAEAELIFQISVVRSEPLVLRLTILDSKTQAAMRELDQDIRGDQTVRGSFAEQKDLDKTIAALVTSVAKLTGQPDAHISVPPDTQAAPPPSMISDSRKVFISRAPDDDDLFEKYAPDQLYRTLDALIRDWGRYHLTAPSEADLILEPSISGSPVAMGAAADTGAGSISVQSVWGIRVRLTIRDAKTRHVLWTFVRPVKMTTLNDNLLSNYTTVIGLLVDDLRQMASPTPQATTKPVDFR